MLVGLQFYFLLVSSFLFFYSISSDKNASVSFGYALAFNIFPLFWLPQYSMDLARLGGIPLAYLPIISAGFALVFKSGLKLKVSHLPMVTVALLFLIYSFITTLLVHGITLKNFSYWFAWPLNLLIFFGAVSFFSKLDSFRQHKVIKSTAIILILGCFVGLCRYFSGISTDANFMPVVNRNGTVVFIVMIVPLLFFLYSYKVISKSFFISSFVVVFSCLLFMLSRSGLLGFLFGVLFYYTRFSYKNILKIFSILTIVIIVVSTGVAEKSFKRFENTVNTVNILSKGEQFDSGMSDYKRVMLMKRAVSIIENNFWFGTGLGLENYRKAFHKVSNYHHDSKAHNFYLSYFAELGFLGFSILSTFLALVYRNLANLNSSFRAFRVSFWVIALMMTMNEYILLPELWFFFGMLVGISHQKPKVNSGYIDNV